MGKQKTSFFCKSCGFESPKWIGKCLGCSEWNTFIEEPKPNKENTTWKKGKRKIAEPKALHTIEANLAERLVLPDDELNLVLGGGLVPGAVVLLGGEPGIGKSTLLLQIALQTHAKTLYVSGEESETQIKLRADRLGFGNSSCQILTETLLENIFDILEHDPPELLVIDSIQTLYSEVLDATPGSISQIRECAGQLLQFAKENDVPVFLVGHITKDGALAGPKILEHMVDTVLQFEGDRHHAYRIIRALKNRFGSTHELGIYEMHGAGLKGVKNPSEIWLAQREEVLSGIGIAAVLEGIRPLLLETQALVSTAVYGTPQRSATGYDLRRLNMLLAILEKRCGFKLGQQDVFINLAGGLRLEDPALDLGLMAAIMSSFHSEPLPTKCVFSAEVGLSGEIRAVQRVEQRIAEAEKLGFTDIVVSKYNKFNDKETGKIQVHTFGRIDEVFSWLFG
ncbi:MAG: DNA repair protein RadA [Bacteroidetes bacterium]|nr:DNA repair protein RadA [Bacteroidota bacterium]